MVGCLAGGAHRAGSYALWCCGPGCGRGGGDRNVISTTSLQWAGIGWLTTGDALLALSAAARARDHDRAARDEAQAA